MFLLTFRERLGETSGKKYQKGRLSTGHPRLRKASGNGNARREGGGHGRGGLERRGGYNAWGGPEGPEVMHKKKGLERMKT